jgi:hypothetical protein
MSRVHLFEESLALSKQYENASWWHDVYRSAFPGLCSAVSVRNDGWAQRGGIDRVLTLACGKTIAVDEKVRHEVYDDICLERWSNESAREPGWIQKPLACDYLAYAFVPIATCYLFPIPPLQRAWRQHGRDWIACYPEIRAQNRSYVTVSVGVPIDVLFSAMAEAMCVQWVIGDQLDIES